VARNSRAGISELASQSHPNHPKTAAGTSATGPEKAHFRIYLASSDEFRIDQQEDLGEAGTLTTCQTLEARGLQADEDSIKAMARFATLGTGKERDLCHLLLLRLLP